MPRREADAGECMQVVGVPNRPERELLRKIKSYAYSVRVFGDNTDRG